MLNATIDSSHEGPADSVPETAPNVTTEDDAREAPPPPRRVVLQFFLGPLLIVLLCALVYFLFGVVVFEKKTPRDFLTEIRSGSASERWQAAFELSRWFASSPEEARDPAFASEVIRLFADSRHQDPRIRRYLALALGRLGDPAAIPALTEALGDEDAETRLYAVWSLGALKDRAALPSLLPLLGSDDPGMVKVAAYAIGTIGDASAVGALEPLLDHGSAEVRWNAALALAQLGDASGIGVLLGMTEPGELARVEGMSETQKIDAMTSAIIALHRLGDPRGAERIRELAVDAPYVEVRRAAASLVPPS